MDCLENQVVIVTGGARGIGAAIVRTLAEEGATVVVADILEAEGASIVAEIGARATFVRHDVTSRSSWEALVADTEARHGPIDVLVNNAGVLLFRTIAETSEDELRKVIDTNLIGSFLGIQAVSRGMIARGRGSIVNISSVDGMKGANGLGAYAASKWGVRGLTKVAALELGPSGVRVNSVHPAGIDTIMANPQGETPEEARSRFTDFPLQRIGSPEEVAGVVLFLCTAAASYVSGAEITVDGGMTAGRYYRGMPGAPE